MGRRKKTLRSTMKNKKRTGPIETRFTCPVCKIENVVLCRIKKADKIGIAHCAVCEAQHECDITEISKPIDVYSDWLDNYEL